MNTWQLQEAKNKFSRVVDNALHDGPQIITKYGTEVAVVLSVEEYRKLTVGRKSLSDFFQESPLNGLDLDLSREQKPHSKWLYFMSYLLDTCVISELVARQPNPKVIAWIDNAGDEKLYLSVITIGEIERGVEKLANSQRKQALRTWLETELPACFAGRILSINMDVMRVWGRLTAELEQRGRPLPAIDSLIAAVAIQASLHLVTRNEDDFVDTGVSIINPWK